MIGTNYHVDRSLPRCDYPRLHFLTITITILDLYSTDSVLCVAQLSELATAIRALSARIDMCTVQYVGGLTSTSAAMFPSYAVDCYFSACVDRCLLDGAVL